jgi:hypothetical protein
MRKRIILSIVFLLGAPPLLGAVLPPLGDGDALAALASAGPAPFWRPIVAAADRALALTPTSVMAKWGMPPSGDKHDYYSLSIYFWPDPAKPLGAYERHDGKVNPESEGPRYDKKAWEGFLQAVDRESDAWVLTRDPRYAAKAAQLLKVWFLDPATKMNPNMDFAQVVPGTKGPANGIIEGAHLPDLVDDLVLLSESPALSAADQAGMRAWMQAYLDWLGSSWAGKKERAAKNNRGEWYDAQAAALAIYVGDLSAAQEALERARGRLRAQVASDGSLPQELKRTKSFHYSLYSLRAFMLCAQLGERIGVDLWNEPGLRQAVDFLAPYADPAKVWPYPDLEGKDLKGLAWTLAVGAKAWKNEGLRSKALEAGWSEPTSAWRLARFR